ncbi:unnamed protein product [Ambrosiozyma monospora]|uniref:Unnamed protein product n=1 Tax=Ambrosiozyma monospora TaxID=43982 RepID=A0A9W6Z1S2_AMBMO|nr:unnamed protein product [Ambrosiozyma monospora]
MLSKFTVLSGNKKSFTMDPINEDKLLSFMLALILKLDDYRVEIQPLAQELSLKTSKLSGVFKSLGCVIKNISAAEAKSLGLSKSAAASYKIASLTVPFKVPEVARRRGGMQQRR